MRPFVPHSAIDHRRRHMLADHRAVRRTQPDTLAIVNLFVHNAFKRERAVLAVSASVALVALGAILAVSTRHTWLTIATVNARLELCNLNAKLDELALQCSDLFFES